MCSQRIRRIPFLYRTFLCVSVSLPIILPEPRIPARHVPRSLEQSNTHLAAPMEYHGVVRPRDEPRESVVT